MSKEFLLTVILITVIFVGAYMLWRGGAAPPIESAPSNAGLQITPSANITIVPAAVNQEGIPLRLGALALTDSMTGKDALNEFTQLHGKEFDLVGGYMAHYSGENKQATLWVAQAKDPASAQAMLEAMAQKIAAGNPIFKDLQALDIGGRALYSVVGQGQHHFFYAADDRVVWLAVDAAQAPDALHALWRAGK